MKRHHPIPLWDFTDFFLAKQHAPCAVCLVPTCWVEVNFETHLHPGPCDVRLWNDYFDALASGEPSAE